MIIDMMINNIDIPSFLIREGAVLNDGEKEQYNFEIHENTTELCF